MLTPKQHLENLELLIRDELSDLLSRTMLVCSLEEEAELLYRIQNTKQRLRLCLEAQCDLGVGEVS